MVNDNHPKIIFLVSGKRKAGKDYISNLLLKRIGEENAVIIRLSAPIKSHWAKVNNLELDELLGSSEYKENYRKAMIEWGENVRRNDYGYFCNAAIEMTKDTEKKPVWIISDVRRKTDLKWFNENYSNVIKKTVRVTASDEIRQERSWTFVKGFSRFLVRSIGDSCTETL
ncbi:phosphomevalonate kinase isoform X2 [Lycorma delicatula]|uniref:phosphomevalonate kinase isoform X2 n=1 Tax=Lycorma delicatula TaxID=130591 RepID=UPI003F515873